MLICWICLLCACSFRLSHHIIYIYCFVASYLFLFCYDWFLRRCYIIAITIIISHFSVLFSVSYHPSPGFYPWFWMREGSDSIYSIYLCILLPLFCDIFSHIYRVLFRRWLVPKSAGLFLNFIYRQELLDILIMCLCVTFLIIPRAATVTGTEVVLRNHILSIFFQVIV